MAQVKIWKIICGTCGSVIQDSVTEPTECPNNAGHNIGDVTQIGAYDEKLRTCDGVIEKWNPTTETWESMSSQDIVISFASGSTYYIQGDGTSYYLRGRFIFRGMNTLGTPKNIKVSVLCSGSSINCAIKIYDETNDQVIVEKTGISNTSLAIVDLGSLANLPDDEAVFEIHLKESTLDNIYVSSLIVEF